MPAGARASRVLGAVAVLGLACAEYIAAPGERLPRGLQLDSVQYTLEEGQKLGVVATVLDQSGTPFTTLPPGIAIAWSSSDTTVASVDTAGVLAGIAAGATQVNAVVSGAFGAFKVSAPVTVRPLVSSIAAVAGDTQSGTVGQPLATRLQVRVTNRLGAGVGRIAVSFTVTAGGASLDTASATTDSAGLASAGLTLGTKPGADTVQARTPRLPGAVVTFVAQALPGPIAALAKVSGDSQSAVRGAALASPLVVKALDRYANPVPGDSVAWAVATGGGAIAPASAVTGAQGTAAAQWTLGASRGAQTATATVGGVLTITFTATATVPVVSVAVTPSPVALASGATQQLTATPKDSAGNPIAGKTVTWVTSDSTLARVSATGLVTAVKVGTATITATVDGVNGTATVTVTPGPASTATSRVTVSAPTVLAGGSVSFTLATRDAAGDSLTAGGLTVGFTTTGGTSAGTIGPVTDRANGTYTATFTGTTAGTAATVGATIGGQAVTSALPTVQVLTDTVVASVTVAPAVDTVASGSTVQLAASAKNAGGTVLAGKPVTWRTGDSAIARVSATGLVTGVLAGTAQITATVQGVAGAASVTVKAGTVSTAGSFVTVSASTVSVGGTVGLKLTSRDAAGNNLTTGGHTVQFTQSGGTSAGTVGAVTDSGNGRYGATFTAITAGTPVAIGATIDGQAITPSGPPPTIQVNPAPSSLVHWINVAGGAWTTAANWNPARVPTLQDTAVVDAAGTYTVTSNGDSVGGLVVGAASGAGATVRFSGAAKVRGSVEVRAGGILDVSAGVIVGNFRNDGETDVETGSVLAVDTTGGGTAQNFGKLTLADSSALNVSRTPGLVNHGVINPGATPTSEGSNLAVTSIAGNVTLASGSAVDIDIQGPAFRDYDVLGITGKATLGDTLRVKLLGGFVPSAGQSFVVVTWTSFSGTFATVILPAIGGQWQVSYTPFGLMLSVVAGPAANVSVAQGDGLTTAAGSILPVAPAVQVTDAGGNPVAGKSVTFAVTSGGGSVIAPATVTTDSTGVATVGGWQIGPTPGTNTMTATVAGSGIAGNPVTFTATGTTPTATWTGAVSTDWSNPANWSPAAVPVATGDVFIGPAATEPVLTAASVGRTVTIQGSGAFLTIGGQTLSASTLNVEVGGLLVMTNAADVVNVSGNVDFSGGNEGGSLTAGQLRVAGTFNQGVNTSAASFAASGTHRVVLTGTTVQPAIFVDLTGASHFQDLDISACAGINIQFDFNGLAVKGTFTSQPAGATTPLLYGLGRSLTARQFQVSRLVVDDAPLILNEGATASSEQLDNVTFQNFRALNGTATTRQLTVVAPGASPTARTLTFNNPIFTPLFTGDTGSYLGVNATTGSLIIDVVGANVTNGPAFTITVGGVTVTWQ